ncbi:Calcium sensing receptor [Heracleum sosnowskyi]|uniref:Calcium sensing receptor n=1 Tax=Heracleum sosnowskyi TaxID=360622 RepID=A0AAD8N9E5_9APIA|nr:Calcium sensing receptor [Heracleum sosnowskyi]
MGMFTLCSATSTSYSSKISVHRNIFPISSYHKSFDVRGILDEKVLFNFSNGVRLRPLSYRSSSIGAISKGFMVGLQLVDTPSAFGGEESLDFTDGVADYADILHMTSDPLTATSVEAISDNRSLISDSVSMKAESLADMKPNVQDILGGITESISASVRKGENTLTGTVENITSFVTSAIEGANEGFYTAVSKLKSSVDQTGDTAGSKLSSFSNDSKEAFGRTASVAVDLLRHTILAAEEVLAKGGTLVVYAYGSAKGFLPAEVQNVLKVSEESADKILRPAGNAFQQVYVGLEGLERSFGLDPSDPIVTLVLLLGTSGSLWGAYWFLTYAGYAGDLSPQLAMELLTGKENAVLIDVRPEEYRERDGVPDLRRSARFRYASVTLPKFQGESSIKKLLKSGKDLDDTLIAAVIRNLKIVQDRSKVIVLDVDGTQSKGIARSLRKLGVKRPYIMQGGFRIWVKEGLRIKELKPETALTILNEEAEAIIKEVNLTPLKVLGYSTGFAAAVYALSEWETTLQFIGIFGVALTIYRRLASYEGSEDFTQDLRQLLIPVQLGGQALTWAAGKLESNGIGLSTSPSSSDVQSRVLQAAAKHESQPSDSELQDPSTELKTSSVPENIDVSQA